MRLFVCFLLGASACAATCGCSGLTPCQHHRDATCSGRVAGVCSAGTTDCKAATECPCKGSTPCRHLNDGSCGSRVDAAGQPVQSGGTCAAGTTLDCVRIAANPYEKLQSNLQKMQAHAAAHATGAVTLPYKVCSHTHCRVEGSHTIVRESYAHERNGNRHHCYSDVTAGKCTCVCSDGFQHSRIVHHYLHASGSHRTRSIKLTDGFGNPTAPLPADTLHPTPMPTPFPTPSPTPQPVDCLLEQWIEDWSECTASCGGGTQWRARSVITQPAHGGAACGMTRETRACQQQPCPVDCATSPWPATWSPCTKLCGIGTQSRSRAVVRAAAHGGAECGVLAETQECTHGPCAVDCETSAFSAWTPCTKSCGGWPHSSGEAAGVQSRSRSIVSGTDHGGRVCPFLTETRKCNEHECPVDCQLNEWGSFEDCTATCGGGTQARTRGVYVEARLGGITCAHTTESQACNGHACPIDCVVGNWDAWSSCGVTCGSSTVSRVRPNVQPRFGGKACPASREEQACSGGAPCPVDCTLTDWSSWGTCSTSCGSGLQARTRSITVAPGFGGKTCGYRREVRTCNHVHCPLDCVVGAWPQWSTCTKSCGNGTQKRSRTNVAPRFGGATCPHTSETQVCSHGPCPVHCVVAPFSAWTTCTKSCGAGGTQSRSRSIVTVARNSGYACPYLAEARACNQQFCPEDCAVGQWGQYTSCFKSCGLSWKVRTRTTNIWSVKYGGEACPSARQVAQCNLGPCPSHCAVSAFSAWSACTKSCGVSGGVQSRSRSVTSHARHGGYTCPYLDETRPCNVMACPVDCVHQTWGSWSACDATCDAGRQTRTRTTTEPQFGGSRCGPSKQSRTCHAGACEKPCVTSLWASWSACTASCSGGHQARARSIVSAGTHGATCPALAQTRVCNTHACASACQVGTWTAWSTCTASCNSGKQTRSRTHVQPLVGGAACPHSTEERQCNTHACAKDCVVSSWRTSIDLDAHGWTQCTKSCGGGQKHRIRKILQDAEYGGKRCPWLRDVTTCNEHPCHVDCELSSWSAWSACTNSCGGGQTSRLRTITKEPLWGGKRCSWLRDVSTCNEHLCVTDCVLSDWSSWGACSRSCGGGGINSRTRSIAVPPSNGAPCPSGSGVYHQTKSCDSSEYTETCPIDCLVSRWSDWGDCSHSCGGFGTRRRTRAILRLPIFGGKECPSLLEEGACNFGACPVHCEVSAFSDWSQCSVSCGPGGTKERTRSIVQAPEHGGYLCPYLKDEVDCGAPCVTLAPTPVPPTPPPTPIHEGNMGHNHTAMPGMYAQATLADTTKMKRAMLEKAKTALVGWYVAEVGASCSDACDRHEGLTCHTESEAKMSAVTNAASAAFAGLTCSGHGASSRPFAPFVVAAESKDSVGECNHLDENAISLCHMTPDASEYYNYQRVCYCQRHTKVTLGLAARRLRGKL